MKNMSKLILITGGARSGKSDYAQLRAEAVEGSRFFVASCPVVDSEMSERIRRHKQDRQNGNWETIEEELDLPGVIDRLPSGSTCLVDCLTLWVNNLMYQYEREGEEFSEDDMQTQVKQLLNSAQAFTGTLFCVSNEVGMGVVPENPLARKYRDCIGRCNRLIAAAADEVILVSCGLPLFIKKSTE